MDIKAIIFDLDGVLCHTDQLHFQAWQQLANRHGLACDAAVNDRLRGISRMGSLDIILGASKDLYSDSEKATLMEEKNGIYCALLQKMMPADLPPDVIGTLTALRTHGLKLAIGSSSKNAGLILARLGLSDFIDAVADGTQITHSKPDPEVFWLAAKLLQVEPLHALVVEDAVSGIHAAKAGGFFAAGIGPAAACPATDFPITSVSQLLTICQS